MEWTSCFAGTRVSLNRIDTIFLSFLCFLRDINEYGHQIVPPWVVANCVTWWPVISSRANRQQPPRRFLNDHSEGQRNIPAKPCCLSHLNGNQTRRREEFCLQVDAIPCATASVISVLFFSSHRQRNLTLIMGNDQRRWPSVQLSALWPRT